MVQTTFLESLMIGRGNFWRRFSTRLSFGVKRKNPAGASSGCTRGRESKFGFLRGRAEGRTTRGRTTRSALPVQGGWDRAGGRLGFEQIKTRGVAFATRVEAVGVGVESGELPGGKRALRRVHVERARIAEGDV